MIQQIFPYTWYTCKHLSFVNPGSLSESKCVLEIVYPECVYSTQHWVGVPKLSPAGASVYKLDREQVPPRVSPLGRTFVDKLPKHQTSRGLRESQYGGVRLRAGSLYSISSNEDNYFSLLFIVQCMYKLQHKRFIGDFFMKSKIPDPL